MATLNYLIIISFIGLVLPRQVDAEPDDDRFEKMETVLNTLVSENRDLKAQVKKLEMEVGNIITGHKVLETHVHCIGDVIKSVVTLDCELNDQEATMNDIPNTRNGHSMSIDAHSSVLDTSDHSSVYQDKMEMDRSKQKNDVHVKKKSLSATGQFTPTEKDFNAFDGKYWGGKHDQYQRMILSGNVAFHAYLSYGKCYNDSQTFVYDVVEVNDGNGYSSADGIFDAPVSGVYAFTWTSCVRRREWYSTELIINGVQKGASITDALNVDENVLATAIVLAHVNAREHVFVRRLNGHGCFATSYNLSRTTFSGWLLYST